MATINYSSLPHEVVFHKILPFLDHQSILNCVRLVCKEWDETCRLNPLFDFPILYSGNRAKLEEMMKLNFHALVYCNSLYFSLLRNEKGVSYLELDFISKLVNLKKVTLCYCDDYPLKEVLKFDKLEEMNLINLEMRNFELFETCPSQIKSFSFTGTANFHKIILIRDWKLINLTLSNCSLAIEDWIELLESESLKNLEHFNFNNCKLSSDNGILEKLSHLKSLKYLSFSMNEFEDDKLKYIGELINLKKLICSQSKFNDIGVDYLSNLVNLEELYLANNEIFGGGFFNFGKLQKLKTLFLTNNKIGRDANFLSSLSNLVTLDLSNNQVVDEGLEDFHNLTKLKWLNLVNNKIGSVGANYLSQNMNLTYLNVSHNSIGEEGLKNFGNLKKLKDLNLNTNNIGSGIRYLAKCQELEHLNCSYNNICDDESLSECFQHFPNLSILELSNNNLSEKCCESISNLTNLNWLNISNNPSIGSIGYGCFGKLINIERLEAINCGITDEGIIEFFTQLSNNNYSKKLTLTITGNHNLTNTTLVEFHKYESLLEQVMLTHLPKFKYSSYEQINKFCFYDNNPTETERESKKQCFIL